jgi:hypothetical protein
MPASHFDVNSMTGRPKFLTFQKSQCKRPFIVIMTDVSVSQTEGLQAVWRFLCLFRNLQIMTH